MTKIKTMEIKLDRTIPAPAAEVFDAWLDPNVPVNPFSGSKKLVFDLKENGLFYFVHHHAGEDIQHYGLFTAIERPKRVQYTWMSPYTHGLESVVTVTFSEKGGETLMSLSHANLPDDDFGRAHDGGWAGYLKKAAELFAARK
jgi:uncharacterized protein YndB with AHSA1/START domain